MNKRDLLLEIVKDELFIFPCHGTDEQGKCNCRNPNCKSPGKHPMISSWLEGASNNISQVSRWMREYPACNWAMRTFHGRHKMAVLDVDLREEGLKNWEQLMIMEGQEIKPTVSTKSGGMHVWFYTSGEVEFACSSDRIAPGIDTKASGGYVIIPPSRGYEFVGPIHSEMPDWLLERWPIRKIKHK